MAGKRRFYSKEENKFIGKHYKSSNSFESFYEMFVRKFGETRTRSGLRSKCERINRDMPLENYFAFSELRDIFDISSHQKILGICKRADILVKKIRHKLMIRKDDLELFEATYKEEMSNIPDLNDYMTTREMADMFGICIKGIPIACKNGFIKDYIKANELLYISREEVDFFANKMMETGSTRIKWKEWSNEKSSMEKS